ncbi:flagellar filament capping protein FliD [bacterium]|nr:flagellar filament capping protein FliD [bacterium]
MSSISSIGGASSIDQLVSQFMALERRPVNALVLKKASLSTRSAVYSDLKGKLQTLSDAAAVLAETGTDSAFTSIKVSSDDKDIVSVATETGAAQGQYTFRVRQLATSTIMKSTGTLNNHASVMSSALVVAGADKLDIDEAWADVGFDNQPDGSITINGATFTLSDYDSVEDLIDAVNDDTYTKSYSTVTSGSGLDTSLDWASAGFDTQPDGTVTINGSTFTLSNYATVDDFITAVNEDATANVTLAYSSADDKFTLTSDDSTAITISETGTNGFFTETNITGPAKANMYYDESRDKFILESTDGSDLILAESGTTGFFTELNIATGTYSSNTTGLDASAKLSDINFDTAISADATGSFKINGVIIEWDADQDTLSSLIGAINSSEAGVTAFYDDTIDKIIMTSDVAGSDVIEMEDVEGTLLTGSLNLSEGSQVAGDDAKFTINSADGADEITKSSNTFTINGLTFTLHEATVENNDYTDSGTTSVTVKSVQDETAVIKKVNSFLNAFNGFSDYISTKTSVNTETYTRDALAGDTIYRTLRSRLTALFLDQVSGVDDDKPSYLSEIGITMDDSLHMTMSDQADFVAMLVEDPEALTTLFNSDNGIAVQIETLLEDYVDTYGIVEGEKDAIADQITLIDKQIDRMEERLEIKAEYYRTQFTQLQQLLTNITFQQNQITSMMSTMNSVMGIS